MGKSKGLLVHSFSLLNNQDRDAGEFPCVYVGLHLYFSKLQCACREAGGIFRWIIAGKGKGEGHYPDYSYKKLEGFDFFHGKQVFLKMWIAY